MYTFLRNIMGLRFLPHGEIINAFQRLKPRASSGTLKSFVDYVEETWINSNIWPPSCWSVFMIPVRTNNDFEGWHNSLNRRASGRFHMPFYLLVNLLHQEAKLAALHIRLVSERKLTRIQRKKYRNLQARIFTL